jgi:hypothetical protein
MIRPQPSVRLRRGQVAGNPGLEQADEVRVHEFVLVGDVQADHAGLAEVRFEFGRKLEAMGALHHKDDVRPLQQLGRDRVFRIVVEARGGRLDAGPVREDLLRRWAAEPVLAADEKNLARRAACPVA